MSSVEGSDTAPTSDVAIAALNQPHFDPVKYLNEQLAVPKLSSQGNTSKSSRSAIIQTSASDVQTLLAKLNTHNVRSTNDLTTLADEILRSGNRLAYEVEILRGDANSLHELLSETLKDDIKLFLHNTMMEYPEGQDGFDGPGSAIVGGISREEPQFIHQLRSLGLVKSRLEAVVTVFGEAMKWPAPPSENSVTNSLISVSAPELGVQNSAEDDKAIEASKVLRAEIVDLLNSDGGGYSGLEAALKRVEELRLLSSVWKGTSEEKGRSRQVEGLIRLVEDRKKALDAKGLAHHTRMNEPQQSGSAPVRPGIGQSDSGSGGAAAGLFRNLQKLRNEIYLE